MNIVYVPSLNYKGFLAQVKLRVGNYQIIADTNINKKRIKIILIGLRKNVDDKLKNI